MHLDHPEFDNFPFVVTVNRVARRQLYHVDHKVFKTLRLLLQLEENAVVEFHVQQKPIWGNPWVKLKVTFPKIKNDSLLQVANAAQYYVPWEMDEDILWETIVYNMYYNWRQKRKRIHDKTICTTISLLLECDSQYLLERVMKKRVQYIIGNEELMRQHKHNLTWLFKYDSPILKGFEYDYDAEFVNRFLAQMRRKLCIDGVDLDITHPISFQFHTFGLLEGIQFSNFQIHGKRALGNFTKQGTQLFGRITSSGCEVMHQSRVIHTLQNTPFMLLQFLLCCEYHKIVEVDLLQFIVRPMDLMLCLHCVAFHNSPPDKKWIYMPPERYIVSTKDVMDTMVLFVDRKRRKTSI